MTINNRVMKRFFALLLLAAGCTTNRPAATNTPATGDEYYQPAKPTFTGQPRLYPDPQGGLGHSEDPDIRVTDVRLTGEYTVLYLTFSKDPSGRNNNFYGLSSISFNPKAVLATPDGKRTYKLIKTTGIPLTPESREIRGDERLSFVLYFERIAPDVATFNLFECPSDNDNSCFNVAGISAEGLSQASMVQPK